MRKRTAPPDRDNRRTWKTPREAPGKCPGLPIQKEPYPPSEKFEYGCKSKIVKMGEKQHTTIVSDDGPLSSPLCPYEDDFYSDEYGEWKARWDPFHSPKYLVLRLPPNWSPIFPNSYQFRRGKLGCLMFISKLRNERMNTWSHILGFMIFAFLAVIYFTWVEL